MTVGFFHFFGMQVYVNPRCSYDFHCLLMRKWTRVLSGCNTACHHSLQAACIQEYFHFFSVLNTETSRKGRLKLFTVISVSVLCPLPFSISEKRLFFPEFTVQSLFSKTCEFRSLAFCRSKSHFDFFSFFFLTFLPSFLPSFSCVMVFVNDACGWW